jgi:hypothetical protein
MRAPCCVNSWNTGGVQREPMTGRACVSLKARFMSAHTLKGSERDGDVGTILTEQPCRL